MEIRVEKVKNPKAKPNESNLGFGKYFTDHMFMMDYTEGKGWHDARIVPFGNIEMDPGAMVLHYAQEVFEGLKAYRSSDDKILLFRPEMNARRMQKSCERLCMPQIPEEDFVAAVNALVEVDKDWVPHQDGTSLYIRPFMFGNESVIGVHIPHHYTFMVIMSPVGAYYAEGMNPTKIYIEEEYVRATKGGTGFTKCGGNYAASLAAQKKAADKGYTQVLWLDGVHRKYVEEVGTMNVMFKIKGEIYTAPLDGSILPGVTRNSCINLLKSWGYKVNETPIDIDFLMAAGKDGTLEEAFGTGTAAVISPIGSLTYKDVTVEVNNFKIGEVTQRLYDTLTGIQWGKVADTYGWTHVVK